ncbi:GNAT family N-acetyltransferase [Uliginosibacterium flavum]|uniref:GNAT family N-acetyltransferase n=1 Tax=Uliginosibacterium flavum TaxID=1396831 RepID=A0ABV2TR50_9RHOO
MALETGNRQDLGEQATSWIKNQTSVFATTDKVLGKDGNERECLVGIATFHTFQQNPVLYHCYLHPFYRGKGLMERVWREVHARYPRFELEPPLSPAMSRFLSKVDHSHVLSST